MTKRVTVLSGIVLDDETFFSLAEACRLCGVHAELIIEMVEEGVAAPTGQTPREWQFSGPMVTRLQTALRLQGDLGVNLAGAALALELLDELEQLRCLRLRHTEP